MEPEDWVSGAVEPIHHRETKKVVEVVMRLGFHVGREGRESGVASDDACSLNGTKRKRVASGVHVTAPANPKRVVLPTDGLRPVLCGQPAKLDGVRSSSVPDSVVIPERQSD